MYIYYKSIEFSDLARRRNHPTATALPAAFIFHPIINHILELCLDVFTVECLFSNDASSTILMAIFITAIPPDTIHAARGSSAFHHEPNRVFVSNWRVRGISCRNQILISIMATSWRQVNTQASYQAQEMFRPPGSRRRESGHRSRRS